MKNIDQRIQDLTDGISNDTIADIKRDSNPMTPKEYQEYCRSIPQDELSSQQDAWYNLCEAVSKRQAERDKRMNNLIFMGTVRHSLDPFYKNAEIYATKMKATHVIQTGYYRSKKSDHMSYKVHGYRLEDGTAFLPYLNVIPEGASEELLDEPSVLCRIKHTGPDNPDEIDRELRIIPKNLMKYLIPPKLTDGKAQSYQCMFGTGEYHLNSNGVHVLHVNGKPVYDIIFEQAMVKSIKELQDSTVLTPVDAEVIIHEGLPGNPIQIQKTNRQVVSKITMSYTPNVVRGYRLSTGELLMDYHVSFEYMVEHKLPSPQDLYVIGRDWRILDDKNHVSLIDANAPKKVEKKLTMSFGHTLTLNKGNVLRKNKFNPTAKAESNQTVKKEDKTMVAGYVIGLGKHGRATSVTIELDSGETITAATIHHSTVSGWKPGDFAVIQYGGPVFKGVPTLYDGSFKKREVPNRLGN